MPPSKIIEGPASGDLVWVDLNPIKGREQAGRRPALVLTPLGYHQRTALAIICPVTSNVEPWPTKVLLPESAGVSGAVLVDQIRAIDRNERGLKVIGPAPPGVMSQVRDILNALLFSDLNADAPNA